MDVNTLSRAIISSKWTSNEGACFWEVATSRIGFLPSGSRNTCFLSVLLVLHYFWKCPPPPLIFSQSEHFKDWTMKSLCSNKQKHAVQRMWANALFVQGNTVVHWPKTLSIRHPLPLSISSVSIWLVGVKSDKLLLCFALLVQSSPLDWPPPSSSPP